MKSFTDIAPYYDQLMDHVRYRMWVAYTKEIIKRAGVKGKKVIDIACGTGEPTKHLIRAGYDVVGIDNSQKMLETARKKLPDVEFIKADCRDFRFNKKFDIAVSYYDSINYLLTPEDLKNCFQATYETLNPNGLFTFDMNTIHVLRDHWDNRIVVRERENLFSIWENSHDSKTNVSVLKLTLFVRHNMKYLRFRETHRERGYENNFIVGLLNEVGFRQSYVYHHLTFKPPNKDTDRVMFVAFK